jgi:hypothetical protein
LGPALTSLRVVRAIDHGRAATLMAAYSTGWATRRFEDIKCSSGPQSGSNQRSFEYDGCIHLIGVDRYARTTIGTVMSLAPSSSFCYDYCRDYLRAMGAGGAGSVALANGIKHTRWAAILLPSDATDVPSPSAPPS